MTLPLKSLIGTDNSPKVGKLFVPLFNQTGFKLTIQDDIFAYAHFELSPNSGQVLMCVRDNLIVANNRLWTATPSNIYGRGAVFMFDDNLVWTIWSGLVPIHVK